MTDFLNEAVLTPYTTAAQLPAHQKGLVVWSTVHDSFIWSDGVRWLSPKVTGYPFKAYSGDFVDVAPFTALIGDYTALIDDLTVAPFIPRIDFSCDQVDFVVSGTAASRFQKIVIYASDGTDSYLPGTLLFQSSALALDVLNAIRTAAVSPALEFKAGKLYWVGTHASAGGASIKGFLTAAISVFQINSIGGAGGVTFANCVKATVTYASGVPTDATSTFSASSRVSSTFPRIRMRVA